MNNRIKPQMYFFLHAPLLFVLRRATVLYLNLYLFYQFCLSTRWLLLFKSRDGEDICFIFWPLVKNEFAVLYGCTTTCYCTGILCWIDDLMWCIMFGFFIDTFFKMKYLKMISIILVWTRFVPVCLVLFLFVSFCSCLLLNTNRHCSWTLQRVDFCHF